MQAEEMNTESMTASTPVWRKPGILVLLALGLGLAGEILFYDKIPGISLSIWVLLAIGVLFVVTWLEGYRPIWTDLTFAGTILFFAVMFAIRLEPLSRFMAVVLVLALFALWVRSFNRQRILHFRWLDYLEALVLVPLEAWFRPWGVLGTLQGQGDDDATRKQRNRSVRIGILLAIPLLWLFTALLSSADMIFASYVADIMEFLRLEDFSSVIGRGMMILLGTIFSLGIIVMALKARTRKKLVNDGKPLVGPLFRILETSIVLGSLNALFLIFVLIQFRYLFGGTANINAAGFTYAEYARSGFGELVAVAVISLTLITILAALTRRPASRDQQLFNGLAVTLVISNLVILASSLMRLRLYEEAYGFSRIRTYTHVMIAWMAVLFVVFSILLLRSRLQHFNLALLIFAIGFSATLNIMNVDAFIVHQNLAHPRAEGELDVAYLSSLSDDAIPALLEALTQDQIYGAGQRAPLLAEMACRRDYFEYYPVEDWQSLHLGRMRAEREIHTYGAEMDAYTTIASRSPGEDYYWNWEVFGPDYEGTCQGGGYYY